MRFRNFAIAPAILVVLTIASAPPTVATQPVARPKTVTVARPQIAPPVGGVYLQAKSGIGSQSLSITGNPAGCYVQVDDPHIATSIPNAVKVNARIQCAYAVTTLSLDVTLWKTGFIFDYLQGEYNNSKAGSAYLSNQGAFVRCANSTQSSFYGEAYATALIGGTLYSATVNSLHSPTIACGT